MFDICVSIGPKTTYNNLDPIHSDMRVILDENIPAEIKSEIRSFQDVDEFLDVDEEHEGILDFELVNMMERGDIMVTRDRELHENLLDTDRKSVYYDIERDNLIEVQVKLAYYIKGYETERIHMATEANSEIETDDEASLRDRFEELKKENARLKSRVNVLEGKLESVLNTARSAFED